MTRTNKIFLGLLVLAVIGLAVLWSITYFKNKPLPVLGQVTAFSLTDSDEQSFEASALKGQVWVADFVFTSCPGPCPLLTKKMSLLQKDYIGRDDVSFVTFTVDPDTDTPAVLRKYAAKYEADTKQWHFLTGPIDELKRVMTDEFKLGYADDILEHSDRIVLIDRNMQIRGYYMGSLQGDSERLKHDLARLVQESE